MSIKSMAAAALLMPCLVRAASPALELRLVDIETTDLIKLVADMNGTNVLMVRPASDQRIEVPRQRLTLADLRQKVLNLAGQKVVQRNDIEIVFPGCQRPRFSAVKLPTSENVTLHFPQILSATVFSLLAEISGLELREREAFPDVDLMIRIQNQPPSEIATALSAALNVELRVIGKTLEVHRLADDASCPAARFAWLTRPEDVRRAKSLALNEKYRYGDCGRKKKYPDTHGTSCGYFESQPLGEFSYHGFVKLSERGVTALVIKPPGTGAMLAFKGDRYSEDFVAVTDVDTDAAHLIRWSFRNDEILPSEFFRVPMSTGKPEAEVPEQVLMRLPLPLSHAEHYPLEELLFERVVVRDGKPLAIVRDVNGRTHWLRVGDYMGLHDGKIAAIDPSGVTVMELVPDNLGGYMESEVRLLKGIRYEHPRDTLRRKLELPVNDSQPQRDFINAARDGDTALMQTLAAKGASLDSVPKAGEPNALFAALNDGSLGAARWLLARKARPDFFVDDLEWTPLLLAVGADDVGAARALLDAGADVDLANRREQTPLRHAVSDGSVTMVKFLLSRGARPRLTDEIGITPFTLAAYHGRIDVIAEFIAAGVRLEDRDRSGYTMLSAAVQGNQLDTARDLVRRGANVNALDGRKRTPLDHALERTASSDMVEFLEASGARRGKPLAE
jgi:ankyrin repeat protein